MSYDYDYQKRWREKNREKVNAYACKYQKDNGYKYRKTHETKEKRKEYDDAWRSKNMGYVSVRASLRKIGIRACDLPKDIIDAMVKNYELRKAIKDASNV